MPTPVDLNAEKDRLPRASLNVKCTLCGVSNAPDKQVRIDFEHQPCPGCGQTFVPNLYGVA